MYWTESAAWWQVNRQSRNIQLLEHVLQTLQSNDPSFFFRHRVKHCTPLRRKKKKTQKKFVCATGDRTLNLFISASSDELLHKRFWTRYRDVQKLFSTGHPRRLDSNVHKSSLVLSFRMIKQVAALLRAQNIVSSRWGMPIEKMTMFERSLPYYRHR